MVLGLGLWGIIFGATLSQLRTWGSGEKDNRWRLLWEMPRYGVCCAAWDKTVGPNHRELLSARDALLNDRCGEKWQFRLATDSKRRLGELATPA